MINDNQDNGTNNGGIYSKFKERLRKIRLSRIKKKHENKELVQERVKEIREELSKEQPVRFSSKGIGEKHSIQSEIKMSNQLDNSVSKVIVDIKDTTLDRDYLKNNKVISESYDVKEENVSVIKDNYFVKNNISDDLEDKVQNIRDNKPKVRHTRKVGYVPDAKENNKKQELLLDLGTEIIDKIKLSFEDKLDELEVLESELFILSLQHDSELELNKVKDIKNRINELIDKINVIIEQYNLYKKNYCIDNVIGIDDSIIVDDIINYKTLLDSYEDEKKFVKEYKALEEFKSLYENLVEIKGETERLQLENEEKIEEYQIRDKKYDDIKSEMILALDIDKKCSLEIEKQNMYFKDLMSKINIIDKEEYVTTHLRGIGNLLGSGLRYMGLLLVAPFTGLIPGISLQTLATRRMVNNAYRQLYFEGVKHIHYDAINYDSELNHHLNDVNYAEDLIDDTLKDVDRLKEDFMSIYNSNIPGYEDTLKTIEQIEKKLLSNQHRVAIVKRNLKNSKKLNEDKLRKVRQLNDSQRSA